MDRLAKQLKRDADNIEVRVSDELDHRIAASLRSVTPEAPRERARPVGFWWASSLTGIAAAAAVILIINLQQDEPAAPPQDIVVTVPAIDWQTETAALTGPLQQELEDLQSDLEKAEKKVREDIGL